MSSAFEIESITTLPGQLAAVPPELRPLATGSLAQFDAGPAAAPIDDSASVHRRSAPVVRAVDEDADEDEDASEPEIIVPPTEPLETSSDFDEDDFDDDFDDDFEEEFDDDEFDSEVTPEDLEASDDDPFEDE